jgi:hypothetical protein
MLSLSLSPLLTEDVVVELVLKEIFDDKELDD